MKNAESEESQKILAKGIMAIVGAKYHLEVSNIPSKLYLVITLLFFHVGTICCRRVYLQVDLTTLFSPSHLE